MGQTSRNLLALLPKSHTDMVAALFRTIFVQPDATAVDTTWDQVRPERDPDVVAELDNGV